MASFPVCNHFFSQVCRLLSSAINLRYKRERQKTNQAYIAGRRPQGVDLASARRVGLCGRTHLIHGHGRARSAQVPKGSDHLHGRRFALLSTDLKPKPGSSSPAGWSRAGARQETRASDEPK